MKRQTLSLLIVFFVLSVFILPKELLAAPYYEGKRITLIVAYPPGGGYDRMARLLAKHLPKYIPGKPTIIVENMEGGAGLIGANHIYNVAKPDGLTFGALSRALPFTQLLKAKGINCDIMKFSWIGSTAVEPSILTLRTDLPYKTIDDLRKAKEPIYIASAGPASTTYQFASLLKAFLGLNLKLVIYVGNPDSILAIESKEADGMPGSYGSLKVHIERGLLRPVLRGRVSEPGIENVPVNEDLTTDKRAKTIMEIYSIPEQIGRPYMAPPGTPADIMNILRDAFTKVTKDPEVINEAKKLMMTINYVPADECLKLISYILNQPKDIVEEFSKYIAF